MSRVEGEHEAARDHANVVPRPAEAGAAMEAEVADGARDGAHSARSRHEAAVMPSFTQAGAKDDEIWSIVAFLKKLPSVSEADYKAWTTPHSEAPAPAAGK